MRRSARHQIEHAIESLIAVLDNMDGDPDLEPESGEEQHDLEDDPAEAGIADKAALAFILAEQARRRRHRH